jgi:hypothetical protein
VSLGGAVEGSSWIGFMGLGASAIRLEFQGISRGMALSSTRFVDLRLHARLVPNRDAIEPALRMGANLSMDLLQRSTSRSCSHGGDDVGA